jgi:hypothetical protein
MPRTPSPRRSAKREEKEEKKLSDNVRAGLRKGRIHSRRGEAPVDAVSCRFWITILSRNRAYMTCVREDRGTRTRAQAKKYHST